MTGSKTSLLKQSLSDWRTGPVSLEGGGGGWGLGSLARIFSPSLARKSSGFAGILLAFMPENCDFKHFKGGGVQIPSPHPPPRLVSLFPFFDLIAE